MDCAGPRGYFNSQHVHTSAQIPEKDSDIHAGCAERGGVAVRGLA